MSDERPRPRYGEYATPQDQAKSLAKSMPPVSPLLTPRTSAAHTAADERRASPTPTQAPARGTAPGRPRRRRWDLFLSVALLAYGLAMVVSGFAQSSSIADAIDQAYAMQNIGEFSSFELAGTIGTAIAVSNFVLYAITLFVTVRLLQMGRVAFYVPLIGGALAAIIAGVLLVVLLLNDPAFTQFVQNAS